MGPLCKHCGKPIPKATRHFGFTPATLNNRENGQRFNSGYGMYLDEELRPKTVEECRRYVNDQIISVGRGPGNYIYSIHTWDGESYVWGGHFHSQSCAAQFGLGMAHNFPTYSTSTYREALKARDEKDATPRRTKIEK